MNKNNNNKSMVVEFPDSLRESGIDQEYIKEAVAAVAYYNGIVSEKQACLLINKSRRYFEEVIIPKFGLSMTGGTDEDIAIEIEDL